MDDGPPGAHTQAAGYCSEQLTWNNLFHPLITLFALKRNQPLHRRAQNSAGHRVGDQQVVTADNSYDHYYLYYGYDTPRRRGHREEIRPPQLFRQ